MWMCPTNRIHVGSRHRKDLGDIDGLAQNIDEVGLLHPITIDTENLLLAGHRRLEACKLLGWAQIPATVLNTTSSKGEHQ